MENEKNIEMTNKEMSEVLSNFCGLLDNRGIAYERNNYEVNMIRFRTKLPDHDITPYIVIHFNPENSALSISFSRIAVFSQTGTDLFQIINDFNADPQNFGCKMFVDGSGEIAVVTNAILKGENTIGQIEDYINIDIVALNTYYGRISELFDNTNNN